MSLTELGVRWTARIAAACIAGALWLTWSRSAPDRRWADRVWFIGWLTYLVHFLFAYFAMHGGSHAAAWEHVAQRTEAVVGWRWGGGLWFNHLFTVLWSSDIVDQCRQRLVPQRRRAIRVYIVMMTFFAVVVFEAGPTRWVGLGACLLLSFRCCLEYKGTNRCEM